MLQDVIAWIGENDPIWGDIKKRFPDIDELKGEPRTEFKTSLQEYMTEQRRKRRKSERAKELRAERKAVKVLVQQLAAGADAVGHVAAEDPEEAAEATDARDAKREKKLAKRAAKKEAEAAAKVLMQLAADADAVAAEAPEEAAEAPDARDARRDAKRAKRAAKKEAAEAAAGADAVGPVATEVPEEAAGTPAPVGETAKQRKNRKAREKRAREKGDEKPAAKAARQLAAGADAVAPVAAEDLQKAKEAREEASKLRKSERAKELRAEKRTPSSGLLDALEKKMKDGCHLLWFMLMRMEKWGTRTDETQLDPAVFAEWNLKKDLDNMQDVLNLLSKGDRQGIATLCAEGAKPKPAAEVWRPDARRPRLFQRRSPSPEPAGSRDTTAQVSPRALPRALPGALPGARSRTPPTPAGSPGPAYSTRGWPAQGASDDEYDDLLMHPHARDSYVWYERPSKETVALRRAALAALAVPVAALAAPEAPVAAPEAQKGRLTYDDDGLYVMAVDSAAAAPVAALAAPEVPAPAPALALPPIASAYHRHISDMIAALAAPVAALAAPVAALAAPEVPAPAPALALAAPNPGAGGAVAAPPVRVKVEVIEISSDEEGEN